MTDGGRGERWKQTDHLGDLEEMFVAWAKAVTTGAVRNHSIDFEGSMIYWWTRCKL